jgi:hypothetical protein
MKLRNKKTGEIKDFGNLQVYAETENTDESQLLGNFDSFKQILEYYEDYIPKEPLIKDEKIREAVRAWAEANGIKEIIIFDHCNNAPYTPVGAVEFAGNASRLKTLFRTEERFDTNRIYTIAELCGEEKECES